jgi:hypothetical protein
MPESLAERVAREWYQRDNYGSSFNYRSLVQHIQAAIDEALQPFIQPGDMMRNAENLSLEDIDKAEKMWDEARRGLTLPAIGGK